MRGLRDAGVAVGAGIVGLVALTALFAPHLAECTVHGQTIGVGDEQPSTARFFLLEGRK